MNRDIVDSGRRSRAQNARRKIRWVLPAVFVLCAVFRVWLGQMIGMWFPGDQTYDDALMIRYACFGAYFTSSDPKYVMLKDLGMPFVYRVVHLSGMPFSAALSCLWILNGILGAVILWQLTKCGPAALCMGLFIMFQPSAFDSWCGTRLYRAALLNPLYLLVLLLAVEILVYLRKRPGKTAGLAVLLLAEGCVFSVTYYVKEDGIWLLATLLFVSAFWILSILTHFPGRRLRARLCLLCLLPYLIFAVTTVSCKAINRHFFGVFETNIRSSGESMRFVSNIYRIDAEDKTDHIWASRDAVEQAFHASEELEKRPELKEYLFHNPWNQGDIDQHPYYGDFMTWALKDALYATGIAASPAEKEAFFRQVNQELELAFAQGRLTENRDRRMLLSSMGAFSKDAYAGAFTKAFKLCGRHVLLLGYQEGGTAIAQWETSADPSLYETASVITGMDLRPVGTEREMQDRRRKLDTANRIAGWIFAVYRIWFPLMLLISAAGIVTGLAVSLKRRGSGQAAYLMDAVLAAGFLGVSYVYSYMIALWCYCFDHDFPDAEKMYSIGVVSVLCAGILLGCGVFYRAAAEKRHR